MSLKKDFIWPFFLAIFLLAGSNSNAQEEISTPSFRIEIFDLPNGRLGNHVQAVAQDSFGFLWFGTQNGLHRWDGYQFKTYINDAKDPNSIASNYIESIYVAKDGTLWLGTYGNGLDRFDYRTETFTHYQSSKNKNSISNNKIMQILEDSEGYLWIATEYGLNRFDRDKEIFKQFLHNPNDPTSLSNNLVRVIFLDSRGTLWFGTGHPWMLDRQGGLNRYHSETESFIRFLHDPMDSTSLVSNIVSAISEDSKGNFWIGTSKGGLHLMDRERGKFQRLEMTSFSPEISTSVNSNNSYELHTRFIFEDQDQKLWIGAWQGGLKYYDPSTSTVIHFKGPPHTDLPENQVFNMFQSSDGSLWAWTASQNAAIFRIIRENEKVDAFTSYHDRIMTIFPRKDGKLWLGTSNRGLILLDPSKKTEHLIYQDKPKSPVRANWSQEQNKYLNWNMDQTIRDYDEHKLFDGIWLIEEDPEGYLWLAINNFENRKAKGLMRFHPESGELKLIQHDPNDSSSLASNMVVDLLTDKSGHIWILTDDGTLQSYQPKTQTFKRFPLPLSYSKEQLNYILSKMILADDGTFWLAGSKRWIELEIPLFLFQFNPETETFKYFPIKDMDEPLEENPVTGLQMDLQGNIWISTRRSIYKVYPGKEEIQRFTVWDLGFSNYYGIAFDDSGILWIISEQLIAYNPSSGAYSIFNRNDLGQWDSFTWRSIKKNREGHILTGASNGYFNFDPGLLKSRYSSNPAEVLISDFQLMTRPAENVNLLYSQSRWKTPKIQLSHDQNMFSVHFAALDFHQIENNRFQYKLEGLENQWTKPDFKPTATFNDLDPGKYTFQVRAASANGIWGQPKSVRIIISHPWWKTWWAYSAYLLVIGSFVYLIYRYQLNRKLAQAETQRLKELDTVKTQLYTNITHEFRTPLTVILGMAQQVVDQPQEHFHQGMDLIIRNGKNLLSLVNQMMDLAKLESGKMSINLIQNDIVSFLKYLIESFHSYAESKDIQIHFLSDIDTLTIDYDPEKVQQIISNLLSNAVKFTEEGGNIYFSVLKKMEENGEQLMVKVRDTGKGIPEEQLSNIFDRFYQVNNTATRENSGSGIGLALTKELVVLLGGKIKVKSNADVTSGNQGTEFLLSLPINRQEDTPKAEAHIGQTTVSSFSTTNTKQNNGNMVTASIGKGTAKVLIIEDNQDVVQYLTTCLAAEYQLNIAMDGQEGIDIAIETTPDLIISDVMMPHKDGFEVCQTLKQDERTSHIPIIMLTAKADIESKLEGLEHGADAYLAKPFHKEELLIRIKKQLELRKNLQSHYLNLVGGNGKASIIQEAPKLKNPEDHFVQKVRKVVEDNMDNFDFSIEMLCKEIHMSNSQLHRKLSALTGFSATQFVRYIRLNKAKELLENPALTITAVAFDTGFQDPSYFGRVFKKEFGVTPVEWRQTDNNSHLKE